MDNGQWESGVAVFGWIVRVVLFFPGCDFPESVQAATRFGESGSL